MNKKGFTLIELLAVIVILAIIALIATPIVLNIIKDSRESAGLRSAEMYLKGVETSVATATINNKKIADGTYPITKEGDICLVELISNTCSKENTLEVEMNGNKPESGTVTIASGKITDIAFTYSNGKTIVKKDGKLVYSDKKNETGKVEYTAYSVGQEVTIGTENFYVLKDSDATQEKVTLLAKECIDTTNLTQSASANTIAFSETNYWSNIEGITYPYDLIEIGEPDASHKAVRAAYDYGVKLGGTGRLMTYSEADSLKNEYSAMIYGKETSSGYLHYWLGSIRETDYVFRVSGAASVVDSDYINSWNYDNSSSCKIRPVVEISKSLITN